MGVLHASVFLHEEYQSEVCWLVEQVDQHNYEPLRERTCEAIRKLQQEWPLYEHGDGRLATESEIRSRPIPSPRELGEWFLIVLAEYLRPCPSPLGNWSVLDTALMDVGWNHYDRELLFKGLPTAKLLKPHIVERSPWPLTDSSPYWFWLHPGWARSGWLPTKEIPRLYKQLLDVERAVNTYDVRQIPDINADNPIVLRDYKVYLQSGYRDTLAMLATAEKNNKGLFMSITFYA